PESQSRRSLCRMSFFLRVNAFAVAPSLRAALLRLRSLRVHLQRVWSSALIVSSTTVGNTLSPPVFGRSPRCRMSSTLSFRSDPVMSSEPLSATGRKCRSVERRFHSATSPCATECRSSATRLVLASLAQSLSQLPSADVPKIRRRTRRNNLYGCFLLGLAE